jgi:hypothetical protein
MDAEQLKVVRALFNGHARGAILEAYHERAEDEADIVEFGHVQTTAERKKRATQRNWKAGPVQNFPQLFSPLYAYRLKRGWQELLATHNAERKERAERRKLLKENTAAAAAVVSSSSSSNSSMDVCDVPTDNANKACRSKRRRDQDDDDDDHDNDESDGASDKDPVDLFEPVPIDCTSAYDGASARFECFERHRALIVDAACGTGKTLAIHAWFLLQIIAAIPAPGAIEFRTPTVSFAESEYGRFSKFIERIEADERLVEHQRKVLREYKLYTYRDDGTRADGSLASHSCFNCSIQSLPLLGKSRDFYAYIERIRTKGVLVFYDESDMSAAALNPNETMRDLPAAFAEIQRTGSQQYSTSIFINANATSLTASLAYGTSCDGDAVIAAARAENRGDDDDDVPLSPEERAEACHYVINSRIPRWRAMLPVDSLYTLVGAMLHDYAAALLVDGQPRKLAVASMLASMATLVATALTYCGLKVLLITASTPEEAKQKLKNAEARLSIPRDDPDGFDVLVYSPTITVGVSHAIEGIFYRVYGIATNTSCVLRLFFQMVFRIRSVMVWSMPILSLVLDRESICPGSDPLVVTAAAESSPTAPHPPPSRKRQRREWLPFEEWKAQLPTACAEARAMSDRRLMGSVLDALCDAYTAATECVVDGTGQGARRLYSRLPKASEAQIVVSCASSVEQVLTRTRYYSELPRLGNQHGFTYKNPELAFPMPPRRNFL